MITAVPLLAYAKAIAIANGGLVARAGHTGYMLSLLVLLQAAPMVIGFLCFTYEAFVPEFRGMAGPVRAE